jgi:signal transduction histidine kinase
MPAIRNTFGEVGPIAALARSIDWSRHPLGPVDKWPPMMRQVIRLAMDSARPTFVLWGAEYFTFLNNAAIPYFGSRHTEAFGRPHAQAYPELWEQELIRTTHAQASGGTPVVLPASYNPYERQHWPEDAWFDVSFTPIRDSSDAVVGLYCKSTDRTQEILNSRRLRTLNRLAANPPAIDRSQAIERALLVIEDANDLSFAAAYLLDASGSRARLVGAVGVEEGSAIALLEMLMAATGSWLPHPFEVRQQVWVENLSARLEGYAVQVAAECAVLQPLWDEAEDRPVGVLALGANPRVGLDDRYREFLTAVGLTISSQVAESQTRQRLKEQRERHVRDRDRTAEINALFAHLVSAQEAAQRGIASEIHDQLGQGMTALRMNVEALCARAGGDAALTEQADRTLVLAQELDRRIDSLSWELTPAALDRLGLSAALRDLVTRWSTGDGIAADAGLPERRS